MMGGSVVRENNKEKRRGATLGLASRFEILPQRETTARRHVVAFSMMNVCEAKVAPACPWPLGLSHSVALFGRRTDVEFNRLETTSSTADREWVTIILARGSHQFFKLRREGHAHANITASRQLASSSRCCRWLTMIMWLCYCEKT